jgi:hypothetical protein
LALRENEATTSPASRFIPSLDDVRISTNSLAWSEDSFELLFQVATSAEAADPTNNKFVLQSVEASLRHAIAALNREMENNLNNFVNVASGMETMAGEAVFAMRPVDVFSWLPWPGVLVTRFHQMGVYPKLAPFFDVEKPLAGQKTVSLEIPLGELRAVPLIEKLSMGELEAKGPRRGRRGYGMRRASARNILRYLEARKSGVAIAKFELVGLEFVEGSIFPKARVVRRMLSSVVAFLSIGAISNIGYEKYQDLEAKSTADAAIVEATKGSDLLNYCGSRFNPDEMRKITENSLYYSEKGISPQEKACRIGVEQVGLKLVFHTGLKVDGKLGPETLAHEKKFGELAHVPGINRDSFFRGALSERYKIPPKK